MDYILRPWEAKDIEAVAQYANNEKIAANLRNAFPFPYTHKDAEQYVSSCIEAGENGQVTRAIEVNGEAVGSIGVFFGSDVYERNAEIGYWLGEPFWGKGIMYQAVKEICNDVFSRFPITRIYAEPFAHNIGSRRTLEKAGFTLEGTLRKSIFKNEVYQDSLLYALIR